MRRLFTFDVVERKLQDPSLLPKLPPNAIEILECLNSEETETTRLEKLVVDDDAICAAVVGAANSALYGGRRPQAADPRGAILLIGERAVRLIVLGIFVRTLTLASREARMFVPKRFADHGMTVGYVVQWLEARDRSGDVTPDEALIVGALHDLSLAALAAVDPGLYNTVFAEARMRRCTLGEAFSELYGEPIEPLSAAVARVWGLPRSIVGCLEQLQNAETQIAARVLYADWYAESAKHGITSWPCTVELDPRILELAAVPSIENSEPDPIDQIDKVAQAWQTVSEAA